MLATKIRGLLPNPVLFIIHLLHDLPMIIAAFLWFERWGQPAVVILPAITWLLLDRRRWASRIPPRLTSAYAILAAGAWLVLGWFYEAAYSGTYFRNHIVSLAILGIGFGWAVTPRKRHLIAIAAWIGMLYLSNKIHAGPLVILFGIYSLYVLLLRRKVKETVEALSWKQAIPAVSALFFLGFIGLLRFAPRPDLTDRVLSQPGVELLLGIDKQHWPGKFSPQVRFVAEDCDRAGVYLGSTGELTKSHDSLAHLRTTAGHTDFVRLPGVKKASNNALLDCTGRTLWVGSEDTSEVQIFSTLNNDVLDRTVPIPGSRPRIFQALRGGRFIAVQDDDDFRPHFLSVEYPRLIDSPEIGRSGLLPSPGTSSILEVEKAQCAFSPEPDALWLISSYRDLSEWRATVIRAAHTGLTVERPTENLGHKPLSGFLQDSAFCAYDGPTDSVWFAQLHLGVLDQVNRSTGKVTRTVPLRRGLRFLTVSEPSRLLAVANYLTGDLSFVDLDSGEVRGTVWMAPRLRWVTFSDDGVRAYAASSAGVFRVSLTKTGILSPETTPPTP